MRYDWRNSVGYEFGSREYYAEIDQRFLASANEYLPHRGRPFDQLIPYEELPSLDVLEIGIGHGTHAQLLAQTAKSFTGIDLTEAAKASTARRFELMGLNGRIMQMDAEVMSFPDASFDFIWSWGVIHHSADTRRVLGEMSSRAASWRPGDGYGLPSQLVEFLCGRRRIEGRAAGPAERQGRFASSCPRRNGWSAGAILQIAGMARSN